VVRALPLPLPLTALPLTAPWLLRRWLENVPAMGIAHALNMH